MNKHIVQETCDLIRKIYKRHCAGGALHIVLDDGNTDSHFICWCLANSIRNIEDDDERMMYVKCACNLLELGDEKARDKCIAMAFRQMPQEEAGINNIDYIMNGKKLSEWTIDDKMAYLEPAFNEYGYSDRQRELFKRHIMDVWPDGTLSISEDIVVEPLYFNLYDEMGSRVKGFAPEWADEHEWWENDE